MVFGVCRRILGNADDADDAVQATFLILATKANSLKSRSTLGAWLHEVARRTALNARRCAAKRREMEKRIEPTIGQADKEISDILPILDEELARLPEKYRLSIVLCDLEGQSRKAAARQLRWPEGTVACRLARGRQLLAQRLTKRGVTLTASALAVALTSITGAVSASGATKQIAGAAVQFIASGSLTGSSVVSAKVLALTQGVLKTMLLSKLKAVTVIAMVALGLVCGVGLVAHGPVVAQLAQVEKEPLKKGNDPEAKKPETNDNGKDESAKQKEKSDRERVNTLINRLKELRPKSGEDEWAGTLRDLIRLGPMAVPELIAEMDATNDEFMLRCLGFVLRGIGDKRAIPALIRALPKACVGPGSDFGFIAKDPELLAFMQKHGVDQNTGTHYGFGRAVNEIRGTLQKLTGMKHGEDEIVHVFLQGTPQQQFLQRSLYQRCAERWSIWWELHWKEHVTDARYSRVNLTPLAAASPNFSNFPQGPEAKIAGRHANHILESVRNPRAKHVFLDLDTGRNVGLPDQLRPAAGQPERLDDILAWAAQEGFDLMGTEYLLPGQAKSHYMLRGLGLTTWQIKTERWKTLEAELRENRPFDMGTRTDGLLARFDPARKQYVPEETGTFLFQTREGGFGAIFVGVEVHDDSLKPGGFSSNDEELSPVAFHKGRRFAYSLITGPTENAKDVGTKK